MPITAAPTAAEHEPARPAAIATNGPTNPLAGIAAGSAADDRPQRVGELLVAGALQVAGRARLPRPAPNSASTTACSQTLETRRVEQLHRVVGRVGIRHRVAEQADLALHGEAHELRLQRGVAPLDQLGGDHHVEIRRAPSTAAR